ncbi:hypothetical protein QLQ85_00710 [Halomonas sp. M4R5S39]|nr:hypothetical protein [Halomonas kalidii]MDI5983296.1 hypothetical protein [Halomonas kalidii]
MQVAIGTGQPRQQRPAAPALLGIGRVFAGDPVEAGFTLDDIWDIGGIAAFFGMSNRLVTLAGTPPNEEFYLMGRVPREK